jgi:fructosamine-3-kinase
MMLTDDKIDQLLRKAGFNGCAVSAIAAGHYNNSYYVDSNRGRFVLRIAPSDETPKLFYEIGMMKSEVTIHRLVAEHTDAPVPEIVYHDFSRQIIDRDYLVMQYLEGRPGPFDDRELGRYVRQIHAIESNEYGYPERAVPGGKAWPALFQSYIRLILDDCLSCGVMDRSEREQFLAIYDRYADALVDAPPSLLHLDLWTQNILTVDGTISAILDFDRGLHGDPELEFAVLDTYGYSTPGFFEGYGRPRPADARAQIRQRLYIVYELIKYAFIRTARGGRMATGRSHVEQCKRILRELE